MTFDERQKSTVILLSNYYTLNAIDFCVSHLKISAFRRTLGNALAAFISYDLIPQTEYPRDTVPLISHSFLICGSGGEFENRQKKIRRGGK